jgi:hypothetical protein
MNKITKIPRTLGTLIIAALLIVAISGCSGQANAHGAIESLSLGTDNITMVIDGQEIIINGDTEITGMLAEGTVIEVKFVVQDDGSLLAVEIEVEDDDEDTDDEDFDIEGTIDSLSDNTSIVVDGQTFLINGDTEIEGTLSANATVEVEYVVQNDGSYLAVEIEVEDDDEAELDDEESNDDEDKDEDTDDEDFEIEGSVESLTLNQDGTGIAIIDGKEILINGDTEIEGILTANATVEVEYVEQDGLLLALEIEVEDDDNEADHDGDDLDNGDGHHNDDDDDADED